MPYRLDFVSSARREFLALSLDVRRRIDAQLLKLPVTRVRLRAQAYRNL